MGLIEPRLGVNAIKKTKQFAVVCDPKVFFSRFMFSELKTFGRSSGLQFAVKFTLSVVAGVLSITFLVFLKLTLSPSTITAIQ